MTGTTDPTPIRAALPPAGVALEVKYDGGDIGTAIWTGLSWRPRYLVMQPVAWRRTRASREMESDSWIPFDPALLQGRRSAI